MSTARYLWIEDEYNFTRKETVANKDELKAERDFNVQIEKSRDAMAEPLKDRPAFAVIDWGSGAPMLNGVFSSKENAEDHVRRLLAKRDPSSAPEDHIFIADLKEARTKYAKSRSSKPDKDSRKEARPDVSKRGSDSDYADKEALPEDEVRSIF